MITIYIETTINNNIYYHTREWRATEIGSATEKSTGRIVAMMAAIRIVAMSVARRTVAVMAA